LDLLSHQFFYSSGFRKLAFPFQIDFFQDSVIFFRPFIGQRIGGIADAFAPGAGRFADSYHQLHFLAVIQAGIIEEFDGVAMNDTAEDSLHDEGLLCRPLLLYHPRDGR
jgi:hypothetical protein